MFYDFKYHNKTIAEIISSLFPRINLIHVYVNGTMNNGNKSIHIDRRTNTYQIDIVFNTQSNEKNAFETLVTTSCAANN